MMWYVFRRCCCVYFLILSFCVLQARSAKALRDKYTNIKTLFRKQFAAEKASRKSTGGGKCIEEWKPQTEALAELAQVLALSIHGTSPNCDDDDDNCLDSTQESTEQTIEELNSVTEMIECDADCR